jgi:hypothetical protein
MGLFPRQMTSPSIRDWIRAGAAGATAQDDALTPRQCKAQTVVNTIYAYIKSTENTLKQPN